MDVMAVRVDYFNWMVDMVCANRYAGPNSFRSLLAYLHTVDFKYRMVNDSDRAQDGVGLRHRFALSNRDIPYDLVIVALDTPCSLLEMILALAIRCEESIMNDPRLGDRTAQWFWKMITTLGLGGMTDRLFDEEYAEEVVARFMERKYEPDGNGGLFRVRNVDCDLRRKSIWVQMCLYLDTMI